MISSSAELSYNSTVANLLTAAAYVKDGELINNCSQNPIYNSLWLSGCGIMRIVNRNSLGFVSDSKGPTFPANSLIRI